MQKQHLSVQEGEPFLSELRSRSSAILCVFKTVKTVCTSWKFGSQLYFYFSAPTKVYIYSCPI